MRRFGGITQVELAEATGLSPATISTIIKQLLATGVVETRNTIRSGRRAQLVTIARKAGLLVGVHVGARSMRIVFADTGFTIVEERALPLPFDHRADTTLDRTALLIVELAEGLGSTIDEVLGVGVAIAAPIDPDSGMVSVPGVLRGWEDIDIAGVLSKRLNRPVFVDNDANLGALGETRLGAARGFRDVLYVMTSYAVGAGIIINGTIHHGIRGTAGEIGHTLVDPSGAICHCGSRGCLNAVVGAQYLLDALQITHGSLTLTDLIRLAEEGDPGCNQVIEDAGATIGTVIANTAVAVSPAMIVVGGELAEMGRLFIEPIRTAVSRRIFLGGEESRQVIASQLKKRAPVMGALALASDRVSTSSGATLLSNDDN